MAVLISGSIAFDTIMVFPGKFRDHILAEHIHILNVSFLVPKLRREFGGCAGNIAYSLGLLGVDALPLGTVGEDFGPYEDWMDRCGISRKYLRRIDSEYTAQAYITTDMDDNQITAFHPGAMNHAHQVSVPASLSPALGILAPNGREAMLEHAIQFVEAGIPFVFDPGQGLPMFSGEELRDFVEKANWVVVNDYEAQLLQDRTGQSPAELAGHLEALLITRGADGSVIFLDDRRIEIPAAEAREMRDPTGCGDAYRAGLLYGLQRGLDWESIGRVASLLGAIAIERHGTQNHSFTPEEFWSRFERSFGYRPEH